MSDEDERFKQHLEKARKLGPQKWSTNPPLPPPEVSFRERVRAAGQQAIKKVVSVVAPDKPRELPASFKKAEDWYQGKLHPEQAIQQKELEIEQVKQRIAELQPGVRQPVQMQREFSNDEEKEAYLQRIRDAMKNASK